MEENHEQDESVDQYEGSEDELTQAELLAEMLRLIFILSILAVSLVGLKTIRSIAKVRDVITMVMKSMVAIVTLVPEGKLQTPQIGAHECWNFLHHFMFYSLC